MAGMTSRMRFLIAGIVVGVATLAAASLVLAAPEQRSGATSTPDLSGVRDRVEGLLSREGFTGFKVHEVMAFSNNDYVAVDNAKGKAAFELLLYPSRNWLMEEPVSMMWNTRYGMMGGYADTGASSPMSGMMGGGMMGSSSGGMMSGWNSWYGSGSSRVSSLHQAVAVAGRWLAQNRSSELAERDGRTFPGYYTLDTTRNGKTTGMLSVNAKTGAVWYHGWHGTFLSEQQF